MASISSLYNSLLRPIIRNRRVLVRFKSSSSSNSDNSLKPKKSTPAINHKQIVYTRTGDRGSSGLFTGERRPKDDAVFEALGTTDELSSAIGLAREFLSSSKPFQATIGDQLQTIQCTLQDLQSTVATPKSSAREGHLLRTKWNEDHLAELEDWIDVHSGCLPPLRHFILPSGGGRTAASLHLSRAICRRAERRLVPLLNEDLERLLPALQYLNRLSSYLFTVARVAAREEGFEETVYRRPKLSPIEKEKVVD